MYLKKRSHPFSSQVEMIGSLFLSISFLVAFSQNLRSADNTEKPAVISIDAGHPGHTVSPMLYGIFFEEINRAGDGGLYAEMIQNRSFEDDAAPVAWTLLKGSNAVASMEVVRDHPLNTNNPSCLRLEVKKTDGRRVAVANGGFKGLAGTTFMMAPERRPVEKLKEWRAKFERAANESQAGIALQAGKDYRYSLYAQGAPGFTGPLTVSLEKRDGTSLGSTTITGIGTEWKKYEGTLTSNATETDARLVISTDKPGTIFLDMISLFPKETFKGRMNGLRDDLVEMLAAMHPAFLRFPGGCFVEGDTLDESSRWKKTIGDVAERPGHWNRWGYRTTDGLGYHEYLQLCEDLSMEPLFVINAGISHKETVPMAKMGEYVQDALDAIEYANGPVDSTWGSLRAKAGHPAPFNLHFMEIGNENGGPDYNERYSLFHDAIKKRYPEINLIACSWQGSIPRNRPLDIVDEHSYSFPEAFARSSTQFESYDRKGPKVYMGEYAVTRGTGAGKLLGALGEAAYMTGLERNSDIVTMTSYAPLLERDGWRNWSPNAIVFDNIRGYGIPSYYAQALFAANRPDFILPTEVKGPEIPMFIKGKVGVGIYGEIIADFRDIKVTKGDSLLFKSNLEQGLKGFIAGKGSKADKGSLIMTGTETNGAILSTVEGWNPASTEYTLSFKVRKVSGTGSILAVFGKDLADSWWKLGSTKNTQHILQLPLTDVKGISGSLENGRWYDVRVEVSGTTAKGFLDGVKLIEGARAPIPGFFAVAGRKDATNNNGGKSEIILKVVNMAPHPQTTDILLNCTRKLEDKASVTVMSSEDPYDTNTLEHPKNVAPRETTIEGIAPKFRYTFAPNSITILRLKESE